MMLGTVQSQMGSIELCLDLRIRKGCVGADEQGAPWMAKALAPL